MRAIGIVSGLVLISGISFLLAGCETLRTAPQRGDEPIQTKAILPVPGTRTGDGAVLLVAEVKGEDLDSEMVCRWRVVNEKTAKSYFLSIKANDPYVFAQLDAGTYKTGRLGCGISRVWDVDQVYKSGFKVEAGRASYLGKLVFNFNGRALESVHKSSKTESTQAMNPAIEATPAKGMEVISAFTAEPVGRGVATSEARDGFDVFAKGVDNPSVALEPLVVNLKKCAKAEVDNDANSQGSLEYVALYKGSRFSEMKSRDAKGLSDGFRSCVERTMMAFHPEAKSDVELRVRF